MGKQVSLILPFPVPLAACFIKSKGGSGIPSKRYKAFSADAREAWLAQGRPKVSGPVGVEIYLTAPDNRARDADNLGKCIFDNLTALGVIEDDSNRFVRWHVMQWVEAQTPCRVVVHSLLPDTPRASQ